MKLFGSYTSPYVRHCRIAMLQEGFDFEMVETSYDESAKGSPTARVPFFKDGDLFLTDSSSITKYLREKAGKTFIADVKTMDAYTLTNTVMDSAINIFLLERDGITFENSAYLKRQAYRVGLGLAELDGLVGDNADLNNEFILRVACLLDWGRYRSRFDFSEFANLVKLLEEANKNEHFIATTPPENSNFLPK